MKPAFRLASSAVLFLALLQTGHAQQAPAPSEDPEPTVQAEPSALDAELFYEVLLGELNVRNNEQAAGFSLLLDAARKTKDPALYQRAVEVAIQSRAGDAALQAARAWKQAYPSSRDANRALLQVLLALNRVQETVEPLRADIALAGAPERNAVLNGVPRLYARIGDKKAAAAIVEQALSDQLSSPATGAAAWTTVGRMRLAAGDANGALDAARRAQTLGPTSEAPALLALELMDPKLPQAEPIVKKYLEGKPLPEMRMAYARALLDAQRYPEAQQQLEVITREKPDLAEAWLVQGSLQLQDNQLAPAETSLKRFVDLAQRTRGGGEELSRGLAQAYLSLAQIAEKRRDYAGANGWLDRIENSQDLVAAQNRRASILARQGKLDEARKLLRALPERTPADARAKLTAEVSLLRDNKQYKAAYDLLGQAIAKDPRDVDMLYDQAMLAEKMENLAEMERLLRQVIALKPDYHHAYNALGYSLADRNIRLPEAKQLVQKALDLSPGDPFISDSLAWVEYRMGNKAEAVRILETAYKARPDAEIAAHLGEVLWSMGQRDKAQSVWREGLLLNPENETLAETLKRLRVRLPQP